MLPLRSQSTSPCTNCQARLPSVVSRLLAWKPRRAPKPGENIFITPTSKVGRQPSPLGWDIFLLSILTPPAAYMLQLPAKPLFWLSMPLRTWTTFSLSRLSGLT